MMKRLILAALLAAPVLAPAPQAWAQPTTCVHPDKPKLPAGKGTKGADMEAAQKKVADYTGKMTAYLKCLDGEKTAAQNEHKGVIQDWNTVIDAYKKNPG